MLAVVLLILYGAAIVGCVPLFGAALTSFWGIKGRELDEGEILCVVVTALMWPFFIIPALFELSLDSE